MYACAAACAALGVSPGPVPLRRLTTEALTAALRRATADPSYGQRAWALAARLHQEDGVRPVLDALDRLGAQRARRRGCSEFRVHMH